MIATLLPMFDGKMNVKAYFFSGRRENVFIDSGIYGIKKYDEVGSVLGLDMMSKVGDNGIPKGVDFFIPVDWVTLFTDIENRYNTIDRKKIILVVDGDFAPNLQFCIARLRKLKMVGFRIAIKDADICKLKSICNIYKYVDCILLDGEEKNAIQNIDIIHCTNPNISICADNIDDWNQFEEVKAFNRYGLYKGMFFKKSRKQSDNCINPIINNYFKLIHQVNGKSDFEFRAVADVVERDTSLALNLLKFVNKYVVDTKIKSTRHAVVMMGQNEIRQWINASAMTNFCTDKTSELMRLSLLRASLSKGIAGVLYGREYSQEAYVAGMLSEIDVMLGTTLEDAVLKLGLSSRIGKALLEEDGEIYEILKLVKAYENGNWTEVDRMLILNGLSYDTLFDIYIKSMEWYEKIIMGNLRDYNHSQEKTEW